MRSARLQARELGRTDLPHLLCEGGAASRLLSRLRHRPPSPGPTIRRRGTDLPDCAGITRDFFCAHRGFEKELHGQRRCTRCTLTDRLHELRDNRTGRIHPQLTPPAAAVVGMPEPLTGLKWLRSTVVRGLLRDLAAVFACGSGEAFVDEDPLTRHAEGDQLLGTEVPVSECGLRVGRVVAAGSGCGFRASRWRARMSSRRVRRARERSPAMRAG